ncbi:hypothetical protein [Confluentibacter flavum]|uniref:Uncharacterized protein n=1 Tax=Confluentibacter flavum TaxID=1909700 RepID=A0A2N3HMB0_9FLAO|nr:hypothetical protein [Confluentibacter flavum]PKQ46077.1 hypothetical protein CSW08_04870 [Confluentibacter flavum]
MTKSDIRNTFWGIGVDSLNRFQCFLDLKQKLSGESYWYALRIAYTDSDNLFYHKSSIMDSFLCDEPFREHLMENDEIEYLKSLPDKVTIYRGMTKEELKSGFYGCSWTLKKEVAEFFADKYNRNYSTNNLKKIVVKKKILKEDIIAFLNNRDEFEVIYFDLAALIHHHFKI